MPILHAALIDLDGTLLDSIPDLAHAANAMRAELDMAPLRQAIIATFVGKGVDHLIRRSLANALQANAPNPAQFSQAREIFFRHYHLVNGNKATIYPGVIDGLTALRKLGLKLAIVTNKPTEFTLPLLARTGLHSFFEAVVCGVRRKPDPDQVLHACDLLSVPPSPSHYDWRLY